MTDALPQPIRLADTVGKTVESVAERSAWVRDMHAKEDVSVMATVFTFTDGAVYWLLGTNIEYDTDSFRLSPLEPVHCPTGVVTLKGEAHTIVGCGSSNVRQDDQDPNVWDCLDCGIWFDRSKEPTA